MAYDKEDGLITMALAVQPRRDGVYVLATIYPATDAAHASGQVYWDSWEGGDTKMILSVDDGLSCMWASPQGSAWCGSTDGNIWTTAPVRFPKPTGKQHTRKFDAPEADFEWKCTTLPEIPGIGLPNIAALWGTDDDCLYAATFQGPVYQWDGRNWFFAHTPASQGVVELDGSSATDVFAVGHDGQILHFNGSEWKRFPLPEGLVAANVITGIRVLSPGRAIAVDLDGHVMLGTSADGFRVVYSGNTDWRGVALLGKRVILASSQGAFEYAGGKVAQLKGGFMANRVFQAKDRLFFIESEQDPDPRVVEYEPAAASAWSRRTF